LSLETARCDDTVRGRITIPLSRMRTEAMSVSLTRNSIEHCELLRFSRGLEKDYEAASSPEARKAKGQVFTPAEVANFMAHLAGPVPRAMRLLDPGAGVGTLTAAMCQRVLEQKLPRSLYVCLFERDGELIPYLRQNVEHCARVLRDAGHCLTFDVVEDDFLHYSRQFRPQRNLFDTNAHREPFDAVISNPPYYKINADSPYARLLLNVVHGQPNIYALFLAASAEFLRPQGQLIAITPRSFCNGLYFREFRRWFLKRMALTRVHLFESRTDTFKEAGILQESVITVSERLGEPLKSVAITRSFGRDLAGDLDAEDLPAAFVVDDSSNNMWIRIPESSADTEILKRVDAWPLRFADSGLRISTGPVVAFRAREFLCTDRDAPETVPLLTVGNVRPFQTVWPLVKNGKPTAFRLCSASKKLVLPTRNYVLLRRFSAKEERRRLTASCFLRAYQRAPFVALENHLNYVYHENRELTEDEVYGLAGLFNSALFDRYFRTISGNTQVNATEVRTMPFPDLAAVARIGSRIRECRTLTPDVVEHIVRGELRMEEVGDAASLTVLSVSARQVTCDNYCLRAGKRRATRWHERLIT
jgi:adenine-specific DNA-methyltransferase